MELLLMDIQNAVNHAFLNMPFIKKTEEIHEGICNAVYPVLQKNMVPTFDIRTKIEVEEPTSGKKLKAMLGHKESKKLATHVYIDIDVAFNDKEASLALSYHDTVLLT